LGKIAKDLPFKIFWPKHVVVNHIVKHNTIIFCCVVTDVIYFVCKKILTALNYLQCFGTEM